MATNAKDDSEKSDAETEEEFKKAVQEDNQAKPEPDSTDGDEEAQSDDESTEDEAPAESTFTKGVPSIAGETPEEYQTNLEKAYQESTKEALRLKALSDAPPPPVELRNTDTENLTPEQLYIRQKMDEDIAVAFNKVQEDYPQVKDKSEYDRFTAMSASVGKNILDAEKRQAPPREVYAKAAVLLGWTQDDAKEKLGSALKDSATSTRTGVASSPGKSKVTDKMIAENQKWYPDKSRAEIIKELEPYIT